MELATATSWFHNVEKTIAANSPTWNYQTVATGDTKLATPPDGQMTIPTWKDELYLEFHRGVYTSQAEHKRNMRDAEEEVGNAEKWSSLAWLSGTPYPGQQLTEAWGRRCSSTSSMTSPPAPGIAVIYRDAQKDYDDVRWATR